MSGLVIHPPKHQSNVTHVKPREGWESAIRGAMEAASKQAEANASSRSLRGWEARRAGAGKRGAKNSQEFLDLLARFGLTKNTYSSGKVVIEAADEHPDFRPLIEALEEWGPSHARGLLRENVELAEKHARRTENPGYPEDILPRATHAIEEAARALDSIPNHDLGDIEWRRRLVRARRAMNVAARRFDPKQTTRRET